MARIAYSTTSRPPTLRNAPPPEYQDETWQDWLERQKRTVRRTEVAASPRDARTRRSFGGDL